MLSSCALRRTLARRFRQRVVPVRDDVGLIAHHFLAVSYWFRV